MEMSFNNIDMSNLFPSLEEYINIFHRVPSRSYINLYLNQLSRSPQYINGYSVTSTDFSCQLSQHVEYRFWLNGERIMLTNQCNLRN